MRKASPLGLSDMLASTVVSATIRVGYWPDFNVFANPLNYLITLLLSAHIDSKRGRNKKSY
jgi:hypothetical protein